MSSRSDLTPRPRTYTSPLRDEQAADTRLRILDAAAQQFAESGYSGTSLMDIARAAGASVETVKLSGPKRELLLAAFEHSFSGSEGIHSLAKYGPVTEITADSDNERYLARIMHFVGESNKRSSLLWTALVSAAAADTQLRLRLDELQQRRRADILALVNELIRRGIASTDIPRETLADTVSFILSPEGYNQLVIEAGWSQSRYEAWLRRTVPLIATQRTEATPTT